MEPLTPGERALTVLVLIGGLLVVGIAIDLLTGMRLHPGSPAAEAERITKAAVND